MKEFLISINPLDVFLWTLRRNEKDTVNLYQTLSPVMQLATGGTMLNFGLWDKKSNDPISAQNNLCSFFAEISELKNAVTAADIGSGLSAPAIFWKNAFPKLNLFCVNINLEQLQAFSHNGIEFVNSTSTKLPFAKKSLDRIVALESAQHFKPFEFFIHDARLALKDSGILALAIPVVRKEASLSKLGILKFTWSSEHYSDKKIIQHLESCGFNVTEKYFVGSDVYEPLANYYVDNRDSLKNSILKQYPKYLEYVLFQSIKKMKKLSEDKTIDYLILKCN